MVAHFVRLKFDLLRNAARREPRHLIGVLLMLVYGLGAAWFVTVGLAQLKGADPVFTGDVTVAAGTAILALFIIVPLVFGVDDPLDPRQFSVFGMKPGRLAVGLGVASLVGIPAIVMTVVGLAQVVAWSAHPGASAVAVLCVPLIVATCVLCARITGSLASLFLATRRERETSGLIVLLGFVVASPIAVVMLSAQWRPSAVAALGKVADVTAWTPLGAAWAAPGDVAVGDSGAAIGKLLIAVAFLAGLWLVWQLLVKRMLNSPVRRQRVRPYLGMGWFRALPGTASGVIAARSLSYWGRDVRYRASFFILPFVPVVLIGVLAIAGVPLSDLVLLPVTIMCFFLGWATVHNDVAYDNSALWLHVSANVSGTADRFGRTVPALALGALVIGFGSPLTAWLFGAPDALWTIVAVAACVLLVSLGVSSVVSAWTPYPAPHPGDSAFAQPQSGGSRASTVQVMSILAIAALAAPTVYFAVQSLGSRGDGQLLVALLGFGSGLAVLTAGVLVGGAIFQRRAPELLAYTMRF